jgi:capsule polysaccharide export protein KpsE/RkpR
MVVEFQSRDPKLAEKVANSIADGYLVMQQAGRQEQAKAAGQWLSGEIDGLRKKVAAAEDRVAAFRSKSNLFVGTNNTTLSNQQLGELNTQLNNARAQKADAEARARAIRGMLQSGKPIEASEVLNSDLVRRLSEQRVTLRAQLAEQSSTLMDRHPRIKELKAQIADLDRQIREEAGKLSRAFENDARIAAARMDSLNASLDQLKLHATSSNGEEVQLRALEREAKAERDLLETYLAKYREATARESIDSAPADGRIISRAIVSNTPAYPKKLPVVLIATMMTLMLTSGYIATAELLRMTAPWGPPRDHVFEVMESFNPQPAMSVQSQIERLAASLRGGGERSRKITLIGAGAAEDVSNTALALARQLSRDSKVLLIGLVSTPADAAPQVPGLSDLARGVASFGQIINRDTRSPLHIIGAGIQPDRALLTSPRVVMALDALMQTYDHVVLDAGTAVDLPSSLIASQAHAVILPAPGLPEAARATMRAQLLASGFVAVSILNRASANEAAPEEVAAA